MSAEKKLYNLEVSPPVQVWEKLSLALDGLETENLLKEKLNGIETNPPQDIWKKIEAVLDSEGSEAVIAAKLINLSEVPPAETWQIINSQLFEEEFQNKFTSLGKLEVAPPFGSWNNIAAELDSETKVIPLQRNSMRFFRYAAAAVMIGLLAWAGINLIPGNKSNTNSELAAATEKTKKDQEITAPVQNANTESVSSPVKSVEITAPKDNIVKDLIAATNKIRVKHSGNLSVASFRTTSANTSESTHTGSEEIVADINALQKNKGIEANTSGNADAPRYLVYLNDEGELVKVSKKLADMKCLYNKNGEVSQNALASINQKACDDLVKSWQEKLSKTPINLSFNPLEMADILK